MTVERKLVGIRIQKFVTQCRPESGILILVASWPPTQKRVVTYHLLNLPSLTPLSRLHRMNEISKKIKKETMIQVQHKKIKGY
jgi:hypothetical protein